MNKDFYFFKRKIIDFWIDRGCKMISHVDFPVGAATMHPITLDCVFKNDPKRIIIDQLCRRYDDVYKGSSEIRKGHYNQIQVLISDYEFFGDSLYNTVLNSLGISFNSGFLVEFIEDNWKSPTMGAFGKGHELRVNGMEVAQLTFFYLLGNRKLNKICFELTYGLERCYKIFSKKMEDRHLKSIDLSPNIKNINASKSELITKALAKKIDGFKESGSFGCDYLKFLKINNIFNIISTSGFVSKNFKNIYMFKISKVFEKIVNKYF